MTTRGCSIWFDRWNGRAWGAGAVVLGTTFALCAPASAQHLPVYSGTLRTAGTGVPVSNGSYEMIFEVFEAQSPDFDGLDPLFRQSFVAGDAVPVNDGFFQVVLDSNEVSSGDLSAVYALATGQLYLQVTVDGEVMTPPALLGAVPAAVQLSRPPTLKSMVYGAVDFVPADGTRKFSGTYGTEVYEAEPSYGRLYAPLHSIPDKAILKTLVCAVVDSDDSEEPTGNIEVELRTHTGALVASIGRSVGASDAIQEITVDLGDHVLRRHQYGYHLRTRYATGSNKRVRFCRVDYEEP